MTARVISRKQSDRKSASKNTVLLLGGWLTANPSRGVKCLPVGDEFPLFVPPVVAITECDADLPVALLG
ncbi:hypothetical protein [uncultured Paracoccus sp.]|uniref:hypothetical protein n=1 Tax=uncultured Paracoccus sp. TaxID=189685 RepID=UPI0025E95DE3|nr:hypothetical protein [uncultured Paracoccus sp.]